MTIQHHTRLGSDHLAGNGGLGRYIFLPGDRSRAEMIAGHFDDVQVVENPRGHTAHLGRYEGVDVLAIPSGMGCASVEIILHELLISGARRIVRVGSCGSLVDGIHAGHVVIATGAVRDEGTTDHYAPKEFPAVSDPAAVQSMAAGAVSAGLGTSVFLGVVHSKDSLYGREFGHGPAGEANVAYKKWLTRCGTVASEMEASALFVLASAASAGRPQPVQGADPSATIQTACVLAVFGDEDSTMEIDEAIARNAEADAIRIALAGVVEWAERDGVR